VPSSVFEQVCTGFLKGFSFILFYNKAQGKWLGGVRARENIPLYIICNMGFSIFLKNAS